MAFPKSKVKLREEGKLEDQRWSSLRGIATDANLGQSPSASISLSAPSCNALSPNNFRVAPHVGTERDTNLNSTVLVPVLVTAKSDTQLPKFGH
jgi:hypothetical protein